MRAATETLPARAAENFFWLGRYAERAEGTVRLLRIVNGRRDEFVVTGTVGQYTGMTIVEPTDAELIATGQPEPAPIEPASPMNITLNATNYISPATKAKMEKSLNAGTISSNTVIEEKIVELAPIRSKGEG